MKEFDVILGIEWLTKFYANLDCVSKFIIFLVPRSLPLNFWCSSSINGFFTSCLAILKTARSDISIAQISVVQEFEDVFRDIIGLPSKREMYFCIELAPGTTPISKTPY